MPDFLFPDIPDSVVILIAVLVVVGLVIWYDRGHKS